MTPKDPGAMLVFPSRHHNGVLQTGTGGQDGDSLCPWTTASMQAMFSPQVCSAKIARCLKPALENMHESI